MNFTGLEGLVVGTGVAGAVESADVDFVAGEGGVFDGGGVMPLEATGLLDGIALFDQRTVRVLDANRYALDGVVVGGDDADFVADLAVVGGEIDIVDDGPGEGVLHGSGLGGGGIVVDALLVLGFEAGIFERFPTKSGSFAEVVALLLLGGGGCLGRSAGGIGEDNVTVAATTENDTGDFAGDALGKGVGCFCHGLWG